MSRRGRRQGRWQENAKRCTERGKKGSLTDGGCGEKGETGRPREDVTGFKSDNEMKLGG